MDKLNVYFNYDRQCLNNLTLAFRIIDVFNDFVILDEKIDVYLNNFRVKAQKHDNGYYVITNYTESSFDLKISSDNYFDKTIHIDLNLLYDRFVELYLIPHFNYKKPPSKLYFDGIADPLTLVYATKLSNRTNIRFLNLDQQSCLLKVLNPAKIKLTSKFLAAVDCNQINFDPFFIIKKFSTDSYQINSIFSYSYQPSSPIQKAFVTQCDDSGHFKLFLNDNILSDERYIIRYSLNNKQIFNILDFNNN